MDGDASQLVSSDPYIQKVPLFGSTISQISPLQFNYSDINAFLTLFFPDNFLLATDLETESIDLQESSFAFIGYGINASDYNWNDFAKFNATGKVLIGLVNDPPATSDEPNLFLNNTLTYYGRWMYKFEEARRQKAKAIFLIHTLDMAGYPFEVLVNGYLQEHVQLQEFGQNRLMAEGWMSEEAGEKLALLCGTKLETWMNQAKQRTFIPIEYDYISVGVEASFNTRRFGGSNVVSMLPGNNKPKELIVFTSHHDHLGMAPYNSSDPDADRIYNGAVDNASGVALLCALAQAFDGQSLSRSVVFLSVTAEESGLLGSQ